MDNQPVPHDSCGSPQGDELQIQQPVKEVSTDGSNPALPLFQARKSLRLPVSPPTNVQTLPREDGHIVAAAQFSSQRYRRPRRQTLPASWLDPASSQPPSQLIPYLPFGTAPVSHLYSVTLSGNHPASSKLPANISEYKEPMAAAVPIEHFLSHPLIYKQSRDNDIHNFSDLIHQNSPYSPSMLPSNASTNLSPPTPASADEESSITKATVTSPIATTIADTATASVASTTHSSNVTYITTSSEAEAVTPILPTYHRRSFSQPYIMTTLPTAIQPLIQNYSSKETFFTSPSVTYQPYSLQVASFSNYHMISPGKYQYTPTLNNGSHPSTAFPTTSPSCISSPPMSDCRSRALSSAMASEYSMTDTGIATAPESTTNTTPAPSYCDSDWEKEDRERRDDSSLNNSLYNDGKNDVECKDQDIFAMNNATFNCQANCCCHFDDRGKKYKLDECKSPFFETNQKEDFRCRGTMKPLHRAIYRRSGSVCENSNRWLAVPRKNPTLRKRGMTVAALSVSLDSRNQGRRRAITCVGPQYTEGIYQLEDLGCYTERKRPLAASPAKQLGSLQGPLEDHGDRERYDSDDGVNERWKKEEAGKEESLFGSSNYSVALDICNGGVSKAGSKTTDEVIDTCKRAPILFTESCNSHELNIDQTCSTADESGCQNGVSHNDSHEKQILPSRKNEDCRSQGPNRQSPQLVEAADTSGLRQREELRETSRFVNASLPPYFPSSHLCQALSDENNESEAEYSKFAAATCLSKDAADAFSLASELPSDQNHNNKQNTMYFVYHRKHQCLLPHSRPQTTQMLSSNATAIGISIPLSEDVSEEDVENTQTLPYCSEKSLLSTTGPMPSSRLCKPNGGTLVNSGFSTCKCLLCTPCYQDISNHVAPCLENECGEHINDVMHCKSTEMNTVTHLPYHPENQSLSILGNCARSSSSPPIDNTTVTTTRIVPLASSSFSSQALEALAQMKWVSSDGHALLMMERRKGASNMFRLENRSVASVKGAVRGLGGEEAGKSQRKDWEERDEPSNKGKKEEGTKSSESEVRKSQIHERAEDGNSSSSDDSRRDSSKGSGVEDASEISDSDASLHMHCMLRKSAPCTSSHELSHLIRGSLCDARSISNTLCTGNSDVRVERVVRCESMEECGNERQEREDLEGERETGEGNPVLKPTTEAMANSGDPRLPMSYGANKDKGTPSSQSTPFCCACCNEETLKAEGKSLHLTKPFWSETLGDFDKHGKKDCPRGSKCCLCRGNQTHNAKDTTSSDFPSSSHTCACTSCTIGLRNYKSFVNLQHKFPSSWLELSTGRIVDQPLSEGGEALVTDEERGTWLESASECAEAGSEPGEDYGRVRWTKNIGMIGSNKRKNGGSNERDDEIDEDGEGDKGTANIVEREVGEEGQKEDWRGQEEETENNQESKVEDVQEKRRYGENDEESTMGVDG